MNITIITDHSEILWPSMDFDVLFCVLGPKF